MGNFVLRFQNKQLLFYFFCEITKRREFEKNL